jgi:hypothetical protein
MLARFTKDKYGWRCTHVWSQLEQGTVEYFYKTAIHMNVSRAPRIGFCRRPHHYI